MDIKISYWTYKRKKGIQVIEYALQRVLSSRELYLVHMQRE